MEDWRDLPIRITRPGDGGHYQAQAARMAVLDQLALSGVPPAFSRALLGKPEPVAPADLEAVVQAIRPEWRALEARLRDLPEAESQHVRTTLGRVLAERRLP